MGLVRLWEEKIIQGCPYTYFNMIASTFLLQLKYTLTYPEGFHSSHTPWVMRGGRLSHFPEGLCGRNLGKIGILCGNWHFGGVIFSGGI